uniref:Uncharacterized protein n=1 Tax=Salix viminalis TaxID=40686 RepID=A0A6N2NDD2_SALVM
MEEDLELERQLKIFNRPPSRSFKLRPSFLRRVRLTVSSGSLKTSIREGVECPQGTVNIRRTTKEDLDRAKSLSRLIPSTANSFVPNSKGHHASESSFDFPSYSDADSRLVTHAISQNMKSPMQFCNLARLRKKTLVQSTCSGDRYVQQIEVRQLVTGQEHGSQEKCGKVYSVTNEPLPSANHGRRSL